MTVDTKEIPVKFIHNSIAMITTMPTSSTYEALQSQVVDLCQFRPEDPFTLKWLDEEQDACTLSSEIELREAVRLTELNKECELKVLVFQGVPAAPGEPCPHEDINIYRHGAKRWKKKYYLLLGHKFAARRFNKNAQCYYCNGRIWGLGQPGYKCIGCKLLLHRRCRHFVAHKCGDHPTTTTSSEPVPDATHPNAYVNNGCEPDLPTSRVPRDHHPRPLTHPVFVDSRTPRPRPGELATNQELVIPISKERLSEMSVVPTSGGGEQATLDDFKLLKVIGRGSYAKVFQVEHIPTQRVYAMKVIKKETILDEEDIEWVQTEKHVFECATNHPFLVGLHSCFQTTSRLFFVIEFVNGGDLMYYMQRNLRLPEDFARFYAAEICLALNFLHERGIIYRDLKLDNVLMDNEGHIKLTDYGMCKEGITADVTTSTFCGTPNYIAPEILKGENYSFSVDWWALGVLMFEMLAGRSPWEGIGQSANPDQNTEDYLFQIVLTRPIRFPRSISVGGTNVLRAFLTKNPTERLGCPPDSNFGDIMTHAFFRPIDWVALERKQIAPPYCPTFKNDYDLIHFDPTFTDEPVIFTPDNKDLISKIDQSEFEGFEYVNPLLMTLEEPV